MQNMLRQNKQEKAKCRATQEGRKIMQCRPLHKKQNKLQHTCSFKGPPKDTQNETNATHPTTNEDQRTKTQKLHKRSREDQKHDLANELDERPKICHFFGESEKIIPG